MLKRRTAKHETLSLGVGNDIGEVGMPTGDEFKAERRSGLCYMLAEPVGHAFGIDAGREWAARRGGRCFKAGFWHKKILDRCGGSRQREMDYGKTCVGAG